MIFDEHPRRGNSRRLTLQSQGIVSVMQDVGENNYIERACTERNPATVKSLDWNVRVAADKHIDSLNGNVRSQVLQRCTEEAITTANVKNSGSFRNKLSEQARQNFYSSIQNQLV